MKYLKSKLQKSLNLVTLQCLKWVLLWFLVIWIGVVSADMENYLIWIVSHNTSHMICHAFKCSAMGGAYKYFRVVSFSWNVIHVDMLDCAVSLFTLSLPSAIMFPMLIIDRCGEVCNEIYKRLPLKYLNINNTENSL